MPDLKKISREAIPRAVQKAERYRLLNQSWATESICLDILEVDPANQPVLVMLLLAITDQFGAESRELARRARAVLARITDPYQRAYYAGIIDERLGHAQLAQGVMHAEAMAHDALRAAMESFEEAERLRQPGNDDAILRWNTCARALDRLRLVESAEGQYEPSFGE
ncbi:MAG: hypothetical protein HOQ17_14385 [Gemmatimonadaceae bacterium]|nr:hypothetical protein [Gemmatimonadaceae bacterium]NUO93041.1 hypothetical protein [Gemmatimonadaceae bacterium]NUP54240.1 hypothetical protein [Gemmatimonadaceae bacterium]NUP72406.1 hypothetical protein [Gemmatimonadaceae bacterium]NUR34862.1 hypothetical protein [Gemmatimonadaceae bacterium]